MRFHITRFRKEIIYLIDLLITSIVCSILFYLMPESNGIGSGSIRLLLPHLLLLIGCGAVSHYYFKTYESLWRYAESKEYMILLLGGVTGFIGFLLIEKILFRGKISIIFATAAYAVSLLGMLLMRFAYRLWRKKSYTKNTPRGTPLAIVGAGRAGVRLMDEIQNNSNSRYTTYCFFDDSIEKIGKLIHNVEVKGPIKNMRKFLQGTPVKEIIIAIPSISPEKLCKILETCSMMKCRVKTLPDTLTLMQLEEDTLSKSIRDVRIEELLGREPVTFDGNEVRDFLKDKVVMVTGGGGSIGSELCRQIAKVQPRQLILIDIYENNAYDIQQELAFNYHDKLDMKVEIATVRDKEKINRIFERYRPNIVFHAAAHKHVPLMEHCPEEAIKNNIFGTYNVVQAADQWGTEKFVLISTDKAVNPTNIMGASKRFCEMILQSMKKVSKTEFVAVRFGNVLGSNGSVIPLFQKQIEQGGPVTITDKRITRFFMTIPEAAQLVLQAGSMANRSEIYVLDMGQPVKILDLAVNLIRLSGYEPYVEIPILETELRPGEKLYEELLMKNEELIATSNHKIFIERQNEISPLELREKLEILTNAMKSESPTIIKKALKMVVITYKEPEEMNSRSIIYDYKTVVAESGKVAMTSVG